MKTKGYSVFRGLFKKDVRKEKRAHPRVDC